MNNAFDIHFKGMRVPITKQLNPTPRLMWCSECGSVLLDDGEGLCETSAHCSCSCSNIKWVEILLKEDIRKILDYMRQNKKARITKEDIVEMLI